MPELCTAHSGADPGWEEAWMAVLQPGQRGLFWCEAGHYVIVRVEERAKGAWRFLLPVLPALLEAAL